LAAQRVLSLRTPRQTGSVCPHRATACKRLLPGLDPHRSDQLTWQSSPASHSAQRCTIAIRPARRVRGSQRTSCARAFAYFELRGRERALRSKSSQRGWWCVGRVAAVTSPPTPRAPMLDCRPHSRRLAPIAGGSSSRSLHFPRPLGWWDRRQAGPFDRYDRPPKCQRCSSVRYWAPARQAHSASIERSFEALLFFVLVARAAEVIATAR
jgi:hypothetical protein